MSIYVPPPGRALVAKAGPIGPGAGVLMTEYLMPMMLPTDPQRKMRMSLKLGTEVSWIRAAERVISGKIGGDPDLQGSVRWHLEDPDGETIDDDYPDGRAVEAYNLIQHPAQYLEEGDKQITVAEHQGALWEITSRHMGLAGQGYWYLDGLDKFGIPKGILYIRPDRIWPDTDERGNLIRWILDPKNVASSNTGTPLKLTEVIQFPLETPSNGFLAEGLIESAVLKAQLNQAIDRHLGSMVSSGGRLSGMFAPKDGPIDDDGTWDQLVRDFRNMSEQPDAAKRVQLMRGPMEYTRTQATLQEMAIIELMSKNRDDLLALWGVPLSQVGGNSPTGLNSGDIRKFDEAALWQNAVVLRLVPMKQRIQRRLLDRWKPLLGWAPKLCLDIPEFDDDSPRYDKVQKSLGVALRNSERRAQLGYDPFGEDVINPNTGNRLDDEVWMPTLTAPAPYAVAPEPDANGQILLPASAGGSMTVMPMASAQLTSGIPTQGPDKPSLKQIAALGGTVPDGGAGATLKADTMLRSELDAQETPKLRANVSLVLAQQKRDIVTRLRTQWDKIKANPRDTTIWWPKSWDGEMTNALRPTLQAVAETVNAHLKRKYGPQGKASPFVPYGAIAHVLTRGAARVTGINDTTKQGLADVIAQAVSDDLSPAEAGDRVEAWSGFDEYRSEMIARTEMMDAYNAASLGSYGELGVEMVEAIDGDGDPECAERDGQVFSLEEADAIEDHPNGTLDWVPVIDEGKAALVQDDTITGFKAAIRSLAEPPVVNVPPVDMAPFTAALTDLSEAIRSQPAPVVNIEPQVVNVSPPVVNVPAPIVNLPAPKPITRKVVRDEEGNITEVREE